MIKKFEFFQSGPSNSKNVKSSHAELYMLANFIDGEIQGSISFCQEVLGYVNDVEQGVSAEEDLGYGNACQVVITKVGVHINLFFDEDDVFTYPLPVFKKALEQWLDFLKTGVTRIVEFDF